MNNSTEPVNAESNESTKPVEVSQKFEEKKWVTFNLSDQEVLNKVNELSTVRSKIVDLEHQKKDAADNFKGQIQGEQAKLNNLFQIISTKQERKEVDCIVEFDYEKKKVFTTHNDDVVEEREMSTSEFEDRPEHIFPVEKEVSDKSDNEETPKTVLRKADENSDAAPESDEPEAFFEDTPDDAPEKLTSDEAHKLQDDINTMMVS